MFVTDRSVREEEPRTIALLRGMARPRELDRGVYYANARNLLRL